MRKTDFIFLGESFYKWSLFCWKHELFKLFVLKINLVQSANCWNKLMKMMQWRGGHITDGKLCFAAPSHGKEVNNRILFNKLWSFYWKNWSNGVSCIYIKWDSVLHTPVIENAKRKKCPAYTINDLELYDNPWLLEDVS